MKKIIVTIIDECSGFSVDIEIPAEQEMETLKYDIVEAINGIGNGLQIDVNSVDLYSERLNRMFFPTDTCVSAGVWNGDVLTFKSRNY